MPIPRSGTDAINKYQFLNREKQPETGYMDLVNRFYDPSIARFMQVDPMAQDAPDWTPYRYGFNNPLRYSDPEGLFESEEEARKYAKDNGIRTGWFSGNKISQQADGSYAINNKSAGTSVFNDKDQGVMTAALVTPESSEAGADAQQAAGPGLLMLTATTGALSTDLAIPEPSDLLPQKWAGYGLALVAAGITYATVDQYILHAKSGDNSRNWRDDKLLSPGEINKLKRQGWDHRDKGKRGGQKDLYKDKNGNVYEKPKGGNGPGEPTGMNLNDL